MTKKQYIPIIVGLLAIASIIPFIYKEISNRIENQRITDEYNLLVSENENTFYPGTTLNGISIEGKTLSEVIEETEESFNNQTLQIISAKTSDNDEFQYKNLNNKFEGFEEYMTESYNSRNFNLAEYKLGYYAPSFTYDLMDDVNFNNADFNSIKYFNEDNYTAPHNAFVEVNLEDYTTKIVKEIEGDLVNRPVVEGKIIEAIQTKKDYITLYPEDFLVPEVYSTDPSLKETAARYANTLGKTINLKVCGLNETISPEEVRSFLIFDNDELTIDDNLLDKYIDKLKKKYDSYDRNYTFHTSKESTVKLDNGNYGWLINKDKTREILKDNILTGKPEVNTEVAYSKSCKTPADNLQGDTYVEVSLTHQKVWMYVKGELVAYSNVTTGDITEDPLNTVPGFFQIDQLKTDCILRGPDWSDFVHYWMRFDPEHAIGLHDATWRTEEEFGGDNRKGNGSHGCVNLPLDTATVIYEYIEMGTPVIVW